MKRLFGLLAPILALLILAAPAKALEIEATSAILIDADSGRILYQQDSHRRLPVASLTKILTALVTLEQNPDLRKTYTLPDDFVNAGEANIWLAAGETHTIEDLLYSTLLRSANDAAQALALATAGSESGFAEMMNARCETLGLEDSHWTNPHGLHNDAHLSSAYDMAYITREAMRIPIFNEIIVSGSHTVPWVGNEYDRVVSNHNALLEQYAGADGVKTGYTSKAGYCLVGSATRDGLRLIGVVLNSDDIYGQMAALLDYGFDNYELRQVVSFGEIAARVPVKNAKGDSVNVLYGNNVRVLLPKGQEYKAVPLLTLPESLETPIDSTQSLGQASFDDGSGNITQVELFPAADMERYTLWGVIRAAFLRILQVLLI